MESCNLLYRQRAKGLFNKYIGENVKRIRLINNDETLIEFEVTGVKGSVRRVSILKEG